MRIDDRASSFKVTTNPVFQLGFADGLFRQPPIPFFRQQTNRRILVFQPGQGGGEGAMPSAMERLNGFYSSAYLASAAGGE
jgi:hypothetical protein